MAPEKESLRVCVYNYKGGAAKTTIVVNLGAALALEGKKVLLMDLDPQCNTTQFYHDDTIGETLTACDTQPSLGALAATALENIAGKAPEHKVLGDTLHPNAQAAAMSALVGDDNGKTTIDQILHALFVGTNATRAEELINQGERGLHSCNPDRFSDKLWLLKGSAELSSYDINFSSGFATPKLPQSIKKYGLINFLMEKYTEVCGFDVVLVDCSPSNSAINQAAALSSDFILPPCQAGLYSAGSVHGLLESVLPRENGWLAMHEQITRQWRLPNGEPKPKVLEEAEWLLPFRPPVLLPIIVTNYGMEDKGLPPPAPGPGGRRSKRKMGASASWKDMNMKFSASQFVYTIKNFVYQKCSNIMGNPDARERGAENDDGPLIQMRANHGEKVIAFVPHTPISIPVSEQSGRAYVELELSDFTDYYGASGEIESQEQPSSSAAHGKKRKAGATRELQADLESGDFVKKFEAEVELVKSRYMSLAKWLVELLEEKRSRKTKSSA